MLNLHKTRFRVIYGDTDKMGFAYYGTYMRWFEIGRTEMFRQLGLAYKTIEEKGIFLPVSEAYCKYLASVHYDMMLIIETSLDLKVKGAVKFNYRLLSEDEQTVHAKGYTKHACVNEKGRVVRPPGFLAEMFAKLTNSS